MARGGVWVLFLWGLGCVDVQGQLPLNDAQANIAAIKDMSPEGAALGLPARVRGVVTHVNPAIGDLFIQNGPDAIYIEPTPEAQRLTEGDEIEVVGVTGAGGFAPVIRPMVIRKLGRANLPAPRRIGGRDMMAGTFDAIRVEAEGIVEGVWPQSMNGGTNSVARLSADGGKTYIVAGKAPQRELLRGYRGYRIRVTGVWAPLFNNRREMVDSRILVGAFDDLKVIEGPIQLDETNIRSSIISLTQYKSKAGPGDMRVIQGKVTAVLSPSAFFLEDDSAGILVSFEGRSRKIDVSLGDTVTVRGIPRSELTSERVQDPMEANPAVHFSAHEIKARESGRTSTVPLSKPLRSADELGRHNQRRVEVQGTVRGAYQNRGMSSFHVVAEFDKRLIDIVGRMPTNSVIGLPVRVGSEVVAKGVLNRRHQIDSPEQMFRLHLGQISDLKEIAPPPMDWRRFLWPSVLLVMWVVILMVAWVAILRRSVRIRTAELAAAGAAKTEFLANVSHEIRSPISAVLGLVDLMEQDPLTAEQKELIQHVRKAGRNLLRILNDILDLSRIEARKLPLEKHVFDLNAELGHLDELYGNVARNQGLRWHLELPSQRMNVMGDATRFQQILGNLVSNAIKFTERGAVTVKAVILRESAHTVWISVEVADTGSGIEPDALSRLFQPFTQIGTTNNRGQGGVGLGLSISRNIATLMGGRIHATSTPGQGSTFCVEIPFEREVQGSRHPSSLHGAAPNLRLVGFRILLVDDQPLNLRILQGMLRRAGARVVTLTCAREALQLLQSDAHAFDAVLMDLQMPGMDGFEAIRAIRKEPAMDGLCVLAMSAAVTPGQKNEALAAGADDFIPRPIEIERLGTVLYRHVRGQDPITSHGESSEPITKQWLPELPKIAGLDPRTTAKMCGGDMAFLSELLQEFENEFGRLAVDIRQDLASGDTEQAAARLHALRGVAAPIGALSLSSAAESLEIACRAPRQRFETFELAMREFLDGIRVFNEARKPAPESKSEPSS